MSVTRNRKKNGSEGEQEDKLEKKQAVSDLPVCRIFMLGCFCVWQVVVLDREKPRNNIAFTLPTATYNLRRLKLIEFG